MRWHGGVALGVPKDLSSLVPALAPCLPSQGYYQLSTTWFPPRDTRWEAGLGECFLPSVTRSYSQQEVRPLPGQHGGGARTRLSINTLFQLPLRSSPKLLPLV